MCIHLTCHKGHLPYCQLSEYATYTMTHPACFAGFEAWHGCTQHSGTSFHQLCCSMPVQHCLWPLQQEYFNINDISSLSLYCPTISCLTKLFCWSLQLQIPVCVQFPTSNALATPKLSLQHVLCNLVEASVAA